MNTAAAWLRGHRKFAVALAAAALEVAAHFFPHSSWVQVAVAVLAAAGVYQVPNHPAPPAAAADPHVPTTSSATQQPPG